LIEEGHRCDEQPPQHVLVELAAGVENELFWSFPYVCPEPVLVKSSFLYINGSKSAVFLPGVEADDLDDDRARRGEEEDSDAGRGVKRDEVLRDV
jgi:hypothetical protein